MRSSTWLSCSYCYSLSKTRGSFVLPSIRSFSSPTNLAYKNRDSAACINSFLHCLCLVFLTYTSFEMGSVVFCPANVVVYKSWTLISFTCVNKIVALNPNWSILFTAESNSWCLSDRALSLVLQSHFLSATPFSLFSKAKFALVIKQADMAGTEALAPWWVIYLKLGDYSSCHSQAFKACTPSSLHAVTNWLYIWIIFVWSLASAFSACFLAAQRDFTKAFVSDITDVTQSSREMTYFGSSLDLAFQWKIAVIISLCNVIPFVFSALNSANVTQ